MTTWCRPDTTVSPDPPKRSSSSSNSSRTSIDHLESTSYHHLAHHPALINLSRERFHHLHYINQHRGRHSIADILGWVDGGGGVGEQMTSDFVDMDVVYSDEPLDLSLDKSKGRKERDFEQGTPIKRAKYHHHQDEQGAGSDPGTDEADADPAQSWNGAGVGSGNGNVQPHLQMAANFSTVLQYYLTAARLWQTSEAMRCQESHNDSEGAGDAEASDPTAAVVAAMAAAAAAAANAAPDPAPLASAAVAAAASATPVPAAKKRKKDGAEAPAASVVDPQVGGITRPRKTRTTFTGKQLFELERIFEQKKYLSSNERQEVARLLNVTGSQIKIWFQNRRTKWKKQDPNTAAELAQLKTASRSQQQQATPSSVTPPVDKAKSVVGDALHSADASASEEGHSDDNSSHRSDSTPPV